MLSVVSPDAGDLAEIGSIHRHTISRPWLDVARGRLAQSQLYCLTGKAGIRVAMMGRLVPEPTDNPWTDPFLRMRERMPPVRDVFPVLAFMYPNYDAYPAGPEAGDRLALQEFLSGVRDQAERQRAKSIVFQFLGPECKEFQSTLAASGYGVFPAAYRAELAVRWPDLAGYLAQFPKRRRDKLKHEMRALAQAGVQYVTRGLRESEEPLIELRRALIRKYGGQDDPQRERGWFKRIGECFAPTDVHLVEAVVAGQPIAFTLFVRTAQVLTALLTGTDYRHPAADYVYFGTSFYAAVPLAVELGVRRIEYGLGSEQAKQARGCDLVPLHWAVHQISLGDDGDVVRGRLY